MTSLFARIFLSFWLVALLLAASLFVAERYWGEDAIRSESQRLEAHAATVATLLADEGMPAVNRWLRGMSRSERKPLLLLDADGHLLREQRLPRPLRERLERRHFEPGIQHLRPGTVAIVLPVPNTAPPLYLGTIVHLSRAAEVPLWLRLGIAVVLSGLITFVLAALITRPIRRLRHAAQSLADGDLSVRVAVQGRDEVAALGRDFNTMADRLGDLLEAQRRLLRDVSHELRSPLARLRVALELARQKGDPSVVMGRIEREADRLEHLVSDVLSLARLEAGNSELPRQPVVLDELLGGIAQDAAFEAEAVKKSVRAELAPGLVVDGEPVLLRSALENVVRNAVRHTANDSAVSFTLQRVADSAVIVVRDHGSGVPESELDKLFKPFYRVDEARDRASGGYGLGLAISRQAIEVHGGTIKACNAEGGGLEVTITLPLKQ